MLCFTPWFIQICLRETGYVIEKNTYMLPTFWHKRRKGESVKDKEKKITNSAPAIRRTWPTALRGLPLSFWFLVWRLSRKIVAISGSWPSLPTITSLSLLTAYEIKHWCLERYKKSFFSQRISLIYNLQLLFIHLNFYNNSEKLTYLQLDNKFD